MDGHTSLLHLNADGNLHPLTGASPYSVLNQPPKWHREVGFQVCTHLMSLPMVHSAKSHPEAEGLIRDHMLYRKGGHRNVTVSQGLAQMSWVLKNSIHFLTSCFPHLPSFPFFCICWQLPQLCLVSAVYIPSWPELQNWEWNQSTCSLLAVAGITRVCLDAGSGISQLCSWVLGAGNETALKEWVNGWEVGLHWVLHVRCAPLSPRAPMLWNKIQQWIGTGGSKLWASRGKQKEILPYLLQ